MSITVLLEAQAQPQQLDALKQQLQQWLVDTRAYPGCESLSTVVNQDDPQQLLMVERWQSRRHYETYLQWREDTGVLSEFAAYLSAAPRIRFFDDTGI